MAPEESLSVPRTSSKTTAHATSSDRGDLVSARREAAGFFGGHDVPSTPAGIAAPGYPGQLAQIEAIAVSSSR